MAIVKRYYSQPSLILGIVLYLCLLICQSGCVTYRVLHLVEEEKPVTLFNRYELNIRGGAVDDIGFTVLIHPEFIDTITDTMNVDTIPILMIDTICFECDYMDDLNCIRMLTTQEAKQKRVADDVISDVNPQNVSPRIRDDLNYRAGELHVLGFDGYPHRAKLSIKCQFVNAIFTARLIDRVSGEEIARETKTVRIRIDRSRRLRSVS
jgi:hypothetical protein